MSWKYAYRGVIALNLFTLSLRIVEKSIEGFSIGAIWYGSFNAAFAFVLIVQALFICVEGVK